MPGAKRRKLGVVALNTLTLVQTSHLVLGFYCFEDFRLPPGAEQFRDEQHRRRAWAAHRDRILEEWDHPGRRPHALWDLDYDLEPVPLPKRWAWPQPIETEEEMVRRELIDCRLAPCRRDGIHPVADEVAEIEADWWRWTLVEAGGGGGWQDHVESLLSMGVPTWYARERWAEALGADRQWWSGWEASRAGSA